jgi:hypothetical protein
MLFEEEEKFQFFPQNTSAFLKNGQEVKKNNCIATVMNVKKEELLCPRLPNLRMQYLQKLS